MLEDLLIIHELARTIPAQYDVCPIINNTIWLSHGDWYRWRTVNVSVGNGNGKITISRRDGDRAHTHSGDDREYDLRDPDAIEQARTRIIELATFERAY